MPSPRSTQARPISPYFPFASFVRCGPAEKAAKSVQRTGQFSKMWRRYSMLQVHFCRLFPVRGRCGFRPHKGGTNKAPGTWMAFCYRLGVCASASGSRCLAARGGWRDWPCRADGKRGVEPVSRLQNRLVPSIIAAVLPQRMPMRNAVRILFLLPVLSGCGYRGDLYHPDALSLPPYTAGGIQAQSGSL